MESDAREDLLGKGRNHAALERVGQVDNEVLDYRFGVLVNELRDAVGIAVQRVPGADERFLLARAAGGVRNHAVDLTTVAEDRVELDRLQNRVVIASDACAVLPEHIQLVPDGLDVGVEIARISVLGDEL